MRGHTKVEYLSFERARKVVRSLNLSCPQEFFELRKKSKLPKGVPPYPNNEFLYDGWEDWDDFLGLAPQIKLKRKKRDPKVDPVTFQRARKYARTLKLESVAAWYKLCKTRKVPAGIPTRPNSAYPKEWAGWVDFLGLRIWDNKLKKY